MSLSADDEFLAIIAHQARVTYATQQLAAWRSALHAWQAGAPQVAHDRTGVPDQLAEYTGQIARWQDYLGGLGETPSMLRSGELPLL